MANKKKNGKAKAGKKKGPAPKSTARKGQGIPKPQRFSTVAPKKEMSMSHKHATCSMTDPFCVHARGAQRPDGGPPSIPYQLRCVSTLSADLTNGKLCYQFVPNVAGQMNPGVSTSTIWTPATSWTQLFDATNICVASAKEVRIVSFGCIVRSAMSATNAKGLMVVSSVNQPVLGPATFPQGTMSNAEAQVYSLAAGTEVSWRSKPLGPTAHNFRPIGEFTTSMTDFDWSSFMVEVSGGDTTNIIPMLTVEYVLNVEFIMGSTLNGLANLQKAAPPPNRVALAAADKIHSGAPAIIEGGIDYVGKKVESFASSALDTLMSEGLAWLGL
jgi:hypothetical protein